MTTPFDATDLQYQADKNFAPDKAKLWNIPEAHDGWVHAHNAIRAELQMFQECCEAVQKQPASTLSDWQVEAFQTIFNAHQHFVHSHHQNEDDIVSPALAKRIHYPEKLTSDHDGIIQATNDLKAFIGGLKAGDDAQSKMADLTKQWSQYRANMEEHLKEEEDIGLPLARAYFTPKEWKQIVNQILKKETKMEMGSFVYHMGETRMRNEFMKEHGIPFFVWYLVFSGPLKMYERRVMDGVVALKSGVQPAPPRKGLLGC